MGRIESWCAPEGRRADGGATWAPERQRGAEEVSLHEHELVGKRQKRRDGAFQLEERVKGRWYALGRALRRRRVVLGGLLALILAGSFVGLYQAWQGAVGQFALYDQTVAEQGRLVAAREEVIRAKERELSELDQRTSAYRGGAGRGPCRARAHAREPRHPHQEGCRGPSAGRAAAGGAYARGGARGDHLPGWESH